MSQITPVPINCLTCTVFTILLVAVVVVSGALNHIPSVTSDFRHCCDSMNADYSPPQAQWFLVLSGICPKLRKPLSTKSRHSGEVYVSCRPQQQSLTIEDKLGWGGVNTPAVHRTQRGFGEPFCGISLRPPVLANTPLVGFYTFHASLPCLLLLGFISCTCKSLSSVVI